MASKWFYSWVVVALGLSSSGCGTSILLSYPIDVPFLRANSELNTARPLAPPIRRSTTITLDSGPLRVICATVEEVPQMEYTRTITFDGVGRAVVGTFAVGEAGMATAFALTSKNRPENWIGFGVLAADAMGALLYAILERDKHIKQRWVGRGAPTKSGVCPAGIVISGGGQTVPIAASGGPQGDVRWIINSVLDMNGTISVSFEGRVATWNPYGDDRCDLAKEINHPRTALFCPQTTPAAGSGQWSVPTGSWKPGRVSIEVGGSIGLP